MNKRRLSLIALVGVAVLAVGGFAAVNLLMRGSNVAPLSLDASPSARAAATAAAASAAPASAPAATAAPGGATGTGLAGTWTVKEGVAGYRVRETFLQQQADTDAVGRSPGVTGSITVSGSDGALSLDAAELTVDMTALQSDSDRRDGQLRGRGLETNTFKESTFVLAGPVALPATFGSADVDVKLPGKLTLHGVTRDVEIAGKARVEADGTVVVVGSLPILFADWKIEAPNVAGVIAVQDNGSMEFRVVLAKG